MSSDLQENNTESLDNVDNENSNSMEDAHTAAIPLNESVIAALAHKTIILVTHQVEFLFEVDKILVMEAEGYYRITWELSCLIHKLVEISLQVDSNLWSHVFFVMVTKLRIFKLRDWD